MTLRRWVGGLAVAALVLSSLAGCAYYNTLYLAKRYYTRSLNDVPYALDKNDLLSPVQFGNSITLVKKLIAQYPRSKWVDDAYVLWAKSLIANEDPREAIRMLEEYPTLYPKGSEASEATFYLGVAYLRARKYERALETLDRFLVSNPKKDLEPYANLERSRALLALERPGEAAEAAGRVVQRFPKNALGARARLARAQALIAQKEFDRARDDYRALGHRAATDEDRLTYLLFEADCLEGGQKYDEALALLRGALSHEREPLRADTTGGRLLTGPTDAFAQRYGRLLTRVGTVHLRAGRLEEALSAYTRVLDDYPHTILGAEAQYRIGYAWETAGDDFEKARAEYGRVNEQGPGTSFSDQANARLSSLDQLAAFRKGGGDTLTRAADGEFLLAEQYLFQLDRPDRALEEYQRIATRFSGTPFEAKALTAQGWVLSRKLKRREAGDSLFWQVVREHSGTEAQLAARDYLEAEGIDVPQDLIKLPEKVLTAADSARAAAAEADTVALTQPPAGSIPLGGQPPVDSLHLAAPGGPRLSLPPITLPDTMRAPVDTTHGVGGGRPDTVTKAPYMLPSTEDTTRRVPVRLGTGGPPIAPPPPSVVPRDTSRSTSPAAPPPSLAPRDTTRSTPPAAPPPPVAPEGSVAPRDTTRAQPPPRAPEGSAAPEESVPRPDATPWHPPMARPDTTGTKP